MPRPRRRTRVAVALAAALACWCAASFGAGDVAGNTGQPVPYSAPLPDTASTVQPAALTSNGRKLNVVEVLADDMRVDDLQYAPNLRRLVARSGVSFDQMYASEPLCCPSRASFLTGMLPHNHHVYNVVPPWGYESFDDSQTIGTSLQAAGYATGFVGKYLNDYGLDTPLTVAADGGHEKSEYFVPPGWTHWDGGLQGVNCNPACGGSYNYYHYAYSHDGVPTSAPKGEYSSHVVARLARTQIGQLSKGPDPFFVSVNFAAPHTGPDDNDFADKDGDGVIRHGEAGWKMPVAPRWAYRSKLIEGIKRGAGVMADGTSDPLNRTEPGRWGTIAELNRAQDRQIYYDTRARAASILAMDHSIKSIITELKQKHEWHNTVFVFWSDNGFVQGEHRRLAGKKWLWNPVARVPLLVTGPGMRSAETIQDPVDVTDLTATLLDIAGASAPHTPDGTSFLPQLEGDGEQGWTRAIPLETVDVQPEKGWPYTRDPAFPTTTGGVVDPRSAIGIRTSQYLYVRYVDGTRELYDEWADPREWRNLAADPRWLAVHHRVVDMLDGLWHQVVQCVGTCEPQLPDELIAGPARNDAAMERAARVVRRTFGNDAVRRVRRHPPAKGLETPGSPPASGVLLDFGA